LSLGESPCSRSKYFDPRLLVARCSGRSAWRRSASVSLPSSVAADPPRCCVDLRCLTTRRSRCLGLATPPASFAPCGVDLGVFRRAASRSVSLPISYHPWPCAHPRGPQSLLGTCLRSRERPLPLPHVHPPCGFTPLWCSQSEESTSRSGPPAPALTGLFLPYLVAGFQSRFGPPAPFPTALTVCSSSNPVVCFDHSHPGGFFTRRPAGSCPGRVARRLPLPNSGDGHGPKGSRSTLGVRPPKRPSADKTTAPLAETNGPVPGSPWRSPHTRSAPDPLARAIVRSPCPVRVAPSGPSRRQAVVTRVLDPTVGVASFVPPDRRLRFPSANGRFPSGTDPCGPALRLADPATSR